MSVLVTGGAGYIGSHTVAELVEHAEDVVVVDDLRKGHRKAVMDAPFYPLDIHDELGLVDVMRKHQVDVVIHFAADSLVGESVAHPLKYYYNNVEGTRTLLSAMRSSGVSRIVFSSSAAVYGEPDAVPIGENAPIRPTSPYGETKAVVERMLRWSAEAHGLSAICLRYFNAAGAHETLPIGEDHDPETHLIPIVLQAAMGQRASVSIHGSDYDTPDGTCIRDYVHVIDLAAAHRLAVEGLRRRGLAESDAQPAWAAFNLGLGRGFSVQEVIDAARQVTGREIPVVRGPRRAGDPAVLIASAEQASRALGWTPHYTDLPSMIQSAWRWTKLGGFTGQASE